MIRKENQHKFEGLWKEIHSIHSSHDINGNYQSFLMKGICEYVSKPHFIELFRFLLRIHFQFYNIYYFAKCNNYSNAKSIVVQTENNSASFFVNYLLFLHNCKYKYEKESNLIF